MTNSRSMRALVIVVALLATRQAITGREPVARPLAQPLARFPLELGEWRGADARDLDPDVLKVLGADDYVNRLYQSGGHGVGLYMAHYGNQGPGDSIHSPLHCLPGNGWRPLSHTRLSVQVADRAFPANRYVVEKQGQRQLVLYWFQGRGRVLASEYANKWYLLTDAVSLRRTDGALVRVITPVAPDERQAERTAVRFSTELYPHLARWLP
jgi:EpsI family protein